MKYYSEVLHKTFDTEKELLAAEKEELKKQEEEKAELTKISNDKKAMAKKVEEADEKLQEAYANYDLAKEEISKIIEETNNKINEISEPALKAIRDAQKNKYDAITDFSQKYGKYSVVYTGEKAYQEMQRTKRYIDSLLKNFWF